VRWGLTSQGVVDPGAVGWGVGGAGLAVRDDMVWGGEVGLCGFPAHA
jgi:hypothetical protein